VTSVVTKTKSFVSLLFDFAAISAITKHIHEKKDSVVSSEIDRRKQEPSKAIEKPTRYYSQHPSTSILSTTPNHRHNILYLTSYTLYYQIKMMQIFVQLFLAAVVAMSSYSVEAFAPSHQQQRPTCMSTNNNQRPRSSPVSLFMVETVKDATSDAIERMSKSVESVIQNLNTIRTGRASPAILDRVKADYYGVETPINQMASISVPSAQQLTVEPFDKSQLGGIERAIMEADLGLTPQNDGSVIRLNIPALTEERRKEMMKQCKAIGEEGKVAVRNIRRGAVDAIKKLEKAGDISEDESKDGQDAIQKTTDSKVKDIDEIVAKKEKEVMKV
jgi:ribosome recycling factor